MRPLPCLALALLLASATGAIAAPALPGPAFPHYADAAAIKADCDRQLALAGTRLRALERRPADARWLGASDELSAFLDDASGPVYLVMNVHPDKSVRDAAQACVMRWQDFTSTMGLNEKLYRAALKVKPADAVDREFMKSAIEGFEDAGVGLPADKRPRAKEINDRITDLGQQFNRNVRDDTTKVPFSVEELAGVPESVWKNAPRDAEGHVLLALDYPVYFPVMERAEKASTRERMWRARSGLGGDANLKLLGEIAQLRREYARLFGFSSYADFILRRRMAENTANAQRFLDEVKAVLTERELRDIAELREAKSRHLGSPLDATRIDRWDVSFYTERVRRERYTVDQEAFRPYFPPQESLQFVMKVAEQMMGIRYARVPAKAWHDDVQAYAVSDAKTGKPLASLYVDMYPREGKYKHAAVFSYRNGSTRLNRVPQAALVVNMDRKGLSLDELETLLHEFGHALHNNLSATRHSSQAGTSVLRDFVEAPSQMLEDWVYDKKVLKLFAQVCPACKQVPDEMIDKALVARDYGKGIKEGRQHFYANFDLALHSADAPEPMALWARMEGATPLGHVEGTKGPAAFSHVAGGYAAGYYGYLWSKVVALDLRTAFNGDRLDPVVGMRYRQKVIGQGSQHPPKELVRDFLGRETNSKAFFEWLRR
ncbi:MAG TPA: M3 family metallopeptidase [Albitalea sp.]|uniref:M3 family metallopeptidase n=1 Tax=Piscinibacter sp. TaxID=1903157 RepID=UPI002ED22770